MWKLDFFPPMDILSPRIILIIKHCRLQKGNSIAAGVTVPLGHADADDGALVAALLRVTSHAPGILGMACFEHGPAHIAALCPSCSLFCGSVLPAVLSAVL